MIILLDTHFLVWMIESPHRITASERAIIAADAGSIRVSAVSVWELRIKWRSRDRHGHRKGTVDPAVALVYCAAQDWEPIPVEGSDSVISLNPPIGHRDPFDEMLLVHAQRLGARLLTRDRMLSDHPLALGR